MWGVVLGIIAAGACGTDGGPEEAFRGCDLVNRVPDDAAATALIGRTFVARSVDDPTGALSMIDDTRMHVEFTRDGCVTATGGCNEIRADVTVEPGRLVVGGFRSTAVGCPPAAAAATRSCAWCSAATRPTRSTGSYCGSRGAGRRSTWSTGERAIRIGRWSTRGGRSTGSCRGRDRARSRATWRRPSSFTNGAVVVDIVGWSRATTTAAIRNGRIEFGELDLLEVDCAGPEAAVRQYFLDTVHGIGRVRHRGDHAPPDAAERERAGAPRQDASASTAVARRVPHRGDHDHHDDDDGEHHHDATAATAPDVRPTAPATTVDGSGAERSTPHNAANDRAAARQPMTPP